VSRHTWERNVVVPERREYWRTFPPLVWFPRCSRCGCLTDGRVFRATSTSEWEATEPECTA
jgi:hypothetical protein